MPHRFSEILVGFDARIVWSEQDGPHPDRKDFRIYLNAAEPYSTDTLVWPSVFVQGLGGSTNVEGRQQFRQTGVKLPALTGPVARTWESLAVLQQYLQEKAAEIQRSSWTIAICAYCETEYLEEYPDDWYFTRAAIRTDPPHRDTSWPLLGYDVADYSLNSTLSAYWSQSPDERRRWESRLNAHHLFTEIADAQEYRDHADKTFGLRDRQEIYGLYRIDRYPTEDIAVI
jgi:hypothetical protein